MRVRINNEELDYGGPDALQNLLDAGEPSSVDKIECWNYRKDSWEQVDYARYVELVEKYNGPIDWPVSTTDCSDIELGNAKEQSDAKVDYVAKGTRIDPVQPTPRTIGKRLGGVRLTKDDMDFLKDLKISS